MRLLFAAFIALSMTLVLAACGGSKLPDIQPKTMQYADGSYGLAEWSPEKGKHKDTQSLIRPDDMALSGAASWFTQIKKRDPKKAAKEAVRREGMRSVKVLAVKRARKDVVAIFEDGKKARVHAVVMKGKIKGKSARAIALVWYGDFGHKEGEPANSGVYVFMAPKKQYEALGGYAIPAARWFGASKTDGKPMTSDGELSPKKTTKQLVAMYEGWGENYLVNQMAMTMMMGQTMAIQQQTLNQMSSYNQSLATCAGMDNCDMSMGADGTWTADIQ